MSTIEKRTYNDMMTPEVQELIGKTVESWQAVTHKENIAATHNAELIAPT